MLFSNEHLWLSSAFSFFQQEYQCTIYRKSYMLQETLWLYSGYQEQLGASGMQIQYNYVTLYTKPILRNAFSVLMHILFA